MKVVFVSEFLAVEGHGVVAAVDPFGELVAVAGAPGVAGLALGIDRPESERRRAEVGDEAVVCSHESPPIGIVAGVADGEPVAAYGDAAAIEESAEVASATEDVAELNLVEAPPMPLIDVRAEAALEFIERRLEGLPDSVETVSAAKPAGGIVLEQGRCETSGAALQKSRGFTSEAFVDNAARPVNEECIEQGGGDVVREACHRSTRRGDAQLPGHARQRHPSALKPGGVRIRPHGVTLHPGASGRSRRA